MNFSDGALGVSVFAAETFSLTPAFLTPVSEKSTLTPVSARVSLLLAALLCGACAPEAPPAPTPPAPTAPAALIPAPAPPPAPEAAAPKPQPPAAVTDLVGWWDSPEALSALGLTAADGAGLATELRKLERSYQTAQRQLYTIRRTQMEMLRDPRVPSADIRRFHRENPQKLLAAMRDADIAARLWVRDHLSAVQQAQILERSPDFFGLRWFRTARNPEQDGNPRR